MRHVRDVIKLKSAGMPIREIARRIGAAPSMRLTIRRFVAAGLSWPLPKNVTDAVVEARLFAGAGTKQAIDVAPSPTGRQCTANSSASM